MARPGGQGPLGSDWQGGWQASCPRSEGDKPFATDGSCNEMLEFARGRVGSLEIEPTSAGSSAPQPQPTWSAGKSAFALWKRALGHDATPGATKASVKIVAL